MDRSTERWMNAWMETVVQCTNHILWNSCLPWIIPTRVSKKHCILAFLDASSHLYKRVCPSIRPYVCRSVTRYFWFLKKRVYTPRKGYWVSNHCVCKHACVRDEDASIVCQTNLFSKWSSEGHKDATDKPFQHNSLTKVITVILLYPWMISHFISHSNEHFYHLEVLSQKDPIWDHCELTSHSSIPLILYRYNIQLC